MGCERLLTKLKMNLFDIIYMSDRIEAYSILETLSNEIKTVMKATKLVLSVYHFDKIDDRIRYVELGEGELPFSLETE